MQTKKQIQEILSSIGRRPKHGLGQNFLIDGNLLRMVAAAGELAPGDAVLEVGPGTGSLTEELLAAGCKVIAVELDRDLAEHLRQKFAGEGNFKLIEADALAGKHAIDERVLAEVKGGARKLVANLPYQIASPLAIELLMAGVELLAITVQKEVAERLRAAVGSEDYGPLSIMAQLLAGVEVLRTFPPQAFWPAPKISSALVRMRRCDQLGADANEFSRFMHGVFSYRRKMIGKALALAGEDGARILEAAGISGRIRPEEAAPDQWLGLFRAARSNPATQSKAASAV